MTSIKQNLSVRQDLSARFMANTLVSKTYTGMGYDSLVGYSIEAVNSLMNALGYEVENKC